MAAHPTYHNIVILTGAGISAESGLQTFRASDGLWNEHRVEDVATPEAFMRDPALVHQFYNARRAQLQAVEPNAAHHALATLEAEWDGDVLLVTQNIDDLHDRARADILGEAAPSHEGGLIHMHGELLKGRCVTCDVVSMWEYAMDQASTCPACSATGTMRPHIVWFGEMPLMMEEIYRALADCDLFISIGTSGNVYPAAGFVQEAKAHGAEAIEMNLEPTGQNYLFDRHLYGPATEMVPRLVSELLAVSG